jgi:hypothetical protein
VKGCVTSLFDTATWNRILVGPDDIIIATPGTTTQGVQEGINYAISNGWPFRLLGREEIVCTSSISIPPCAHADLDLGTATFQWPASATCPAIVIDSFNGGRFSHKGRLAHLGTPNVVVYIAPRSADPKFGQKIIQNADIQFGDVHAYGSGTQKLAQIDLGSGEVINNQHLDFLKLDGWNGAQNCAQWGLLVTNPGGNGDIGFNQNSISIGQLMGFYESGVQVGLGPLNQAYLGNNHWNVNANAVSGAPTCAFTSYACFDFIELGCTGYPPGQLQYPLILRPGASANRYLIRQSTAQHPVSDSGTGNRAL